MWKWINGGVTAPQGFRAGGFSSGLKKSGNPDLGAVFSDVSATAVGAFTQNRVKAAPVVLNSRRMGGGISGIVVNSGNANSCTGKRGMRDAREMVACAEKAFGVPAGRFLVCSTGVIGEFLPMKKVCAGIKELPARLGPGGDKRFASSILTTDLKTKSAALQLRLGGKTIRIGGACKGSGMIHPHLATMLAFITTDARVPKSVLAGLFRKSVDESFNRVIVDGDSSTNDSCLLLANGTAGNRPFTVNEKARFGKALEALMVRLAKMIAADGEGATKLVEIHVKGAPTKADARKAAEAIAKSPLVKTALFGNDPNWGRILCAAGYSGAEFRPDGLGLSLCGVPLVRKAQPVKFNAKQVSRKMKRPEVKIGVDLGSGKNTATVWSCDFSYDYVKINAEYHT